MEPSITSVRAAVNTMVSSVLLLAALLLWISSLKRVDLSQMNDFGLVSVLPAAFFAALAVLTISFIWLLRRPKLNQVLLMLHLAALIFIIHGTPQILYGTLRYSWAWKHLGIIDYIQRYGTVDPTIAYLAAYHNWPGFFTLAAFLNQVAGLKGSLSYAGWAPVFFNLLDLGVLLVIYKILTPDKRLAWMGAWLFYLANWVGQDYFSPQAMALFLYLVVTAVVLKWFRVRQVPDLAAIKRWLRNSRLASIYHKIVVRGILANPAASPVSSRQRTVIMAVLVMICAVIASSHQLTPLMAISALTLLVLFQVSNQPYLPVLMTALTVIWIVFMAVGFLDANLQWVVKSFGLVSHNVQSNLLNLSDASLAQQWIAWIDRFVSLLVWLLGGLGLLRRYRSGYFDLPAALMAFAPIPMLAVNSYGGEMLFRVYLFSLPFMAFFAAALLLPGLQPRKTPAGRVIFTGFMCFSLLTGFFFGYYGKERMYYFTKNEMAAAQYLFDTAPKGSLIVDGTWNWPKQYVHYEFYDYVSIATRDDTMKRILADPVKELSYLMDTPKWYSVATSMAETTLDVGFNAKAAGVFDTIHDLDYSAAYFILTRSQIAQAEMTGIIPANQLTRIATLLSISPEFKVVYQNSDALILQFVDRTEKPGE